jgi:hypothetical protein
VRVTLKVDSATTREVRALIGALYQFGIDPPRVGLNGPEKWAADTIPLTLSDAILILGVVEESTS